MTDVRIRIPYGFPANIETELSAIAQGEDLEVHIDRYAPRPVMGIDWLLPTAVVVLFSAKFFEGVASAAGEDIYRGLKRYLTFFASATLSQRIYKKVTPQGVITEVASRSSGFSIVVNITPQIRATFLFREALSKTDYEREVDEILRATEILKEKIAKGVDVAIHANRVLYLEFKDGWQIIDVQEEMKALVSKSEL